MAVDSRLRMNVSKGDDEHQNERQNGSHHSTSRLRSHGQRLTATLVLSFLVHSLDDERIDHQLGSALAGVENHSQNESALVIGDDEAIEAEGNTNKNRVEHEIGNTLVFQNGEGIRNVSENKLDGKQSAKRTLKLHGM